MNGQFAARRAAEQAAAWVARVDAGPLDDEERRDHERWLAASPLHREEYEAARQIFSRAAQLKSSALMEALTIDVAPERSVTSRRTAIAWIAAAAALGAVVVGSYTFVRPEPKVFSTAIGERRDVRLEDGSVVTLNTDSRIRVPGWRKTRSVELEQGEAFFSVAHDAGRPFVVQAGGGTVRVLGTKFNVRLDPMHTTLAVVEGRVELSWAARGGDIARYVFAAGEGTIYGHDTTLLSAQQLQLDRITAWRSGKFMFSGTTLDEVVREINRYSSNKVMIADPGLAGLRISGTFPTDRIPDLLQMLEKAAPVHVVTRSDTILLVAR